MALLLCFWVPDVILYMGWSKFWITLLAEVFIWGLFAVAFNLLMGYTGMISFGQAAYLGIGGYTAGLLLKKVSGFPFALGLITAPTSGALAALIIGYFCIRLTHTYFAMLTLAFSMIVYYTATTSGRLRSEPPSGRGTVLPCTLPLARDRTSPHASPSGKSVKIFCRVCGGERRRSDR